MTRIATRPTGRVSDAGAGERVSPSRDPEGAIDSEDVDAGRWNSGEAHANRLNVLSAQCAIDARRPKVDASIAEEPIETSPLRIGRIVITAAVIVFDTESRLSP